MNDALLLIGHGSSRYPDAAAALHRHAAALRAAGRFPQVEAAVLNGAPTPADAIARIGAPTIRVVPFFMEDGYFTRVALPRALGAAATGHRTIVCPPIGTHDAIAGLIERHALAACLTLGVPSHTAAVLAVGHGSASAPGQPLALHRHAARVAATTLFARVEPACLEEPPFVADVLAALRAHPVVIVGCFANQGGHVRDDLPALIAAEQAASPRQIQFQGSLADDPAMLAIILEQSCSLA